VSRLRVVVTGLGLVTPLGQDVPSSWSAIVAGQNGCGPITIFDAEPFAVHFACEVKNWRPEEKLGKKLVKELDRYSELSLVAADEAMKDSGLTLDEEAEERAGCIMGTGVGGLATLEDCATKLVEKAGAKLSPYSIPAFAPNLAAGQVSIRHRLRGPSYCVASACATGAHALGEAAEWIRRGHADVMVAGSSEAPITPVGMGGFQAMRALSKRNEDPMHASRPFDLGRDGFVAGEGAGVMILEELEHAKKRGARIYAELTGYGASSDAFHIAVPPENGDGSSRSMKMALADAGLAPDTVGYVNAHATSTPLGDIAESNGIRRVFGAHATDKKLLVSATKSMIGHTLGGAGSIEAIVAVLALRHGIVPPTINVESQDPAIPLDVVANTSRQATLRHVLKNAFGFGGANASLVFSAL
jgi:3-oxoacyl-[acyl-carrier-protein] synthase II